MKKIYIGTNWKMHKTAEEAIDYTKGLIPLALKYPEFQMFIIPPYTDLWRVRQTLSAGELLLGAQNMHECDEGAYTGEISGRMLAEIGVDLVELGHSERREYYNETDYSVNLKAHAALKYGFRALICVGEPLVEKEYGVSGEYLQRQVRIALRGIPAQSADRIWIAYEPVWAIGATGVPAEAGYVGKMHTCIRDTLCDLYAEHGRRVPILFGGSVNRGNSVSYLRQPNVNGLFIGRAAWTVNGFDQIMAEIRANDQRL